MGKSFKLFFGGETLSSKVDTVGLFYAPTDKGELSFLKIILICIFLQKIYYYVTLFCKE